MSEQSSVLRRLISIFRRGVQWLSALRTLRMAGVEHGSLPGFRGRSPQLNVEGTMRVGDRFTIRGDQFPAQITVRHGGSLIIGDRCFLNQGANVLAASQVTIGDGCQIGDLAAIRDTDTHQVAPGIPPKTEPVHIGRNVWIGRGALIMPGVTIGDHAVVAAGAIVTRDVARATVVAGSPAKLVREFEVPDDSWDRP